MYLTGPGSFVARDVPEPELRVPRDVLLAHAVPSGICGSDLHYFRTGRIGTQVLARALDHGARVHRARWRRSARRSRGLARGDRVAVDPLIACGALRPVPERPRAHLPRPALSRLSRATAGLPVRTPRDAERVLLPGAGPAVGGRRGHGGAVCHRAARPAPATATSQGKAIAILGAGPIGLCVLAALRSGGASARSSPIGSPIG